MLALSHYYNHPSGNLIPDPDMTLQVLREDQTAEALTYQDMYRDDVVYPDSDSFEGEFNTVNPTAIKSLNAFQCPMAVEAAQSEPQIMVNL